MNMKRMRGRNHRQGGGGGGGSGGGGFRNQQNGIPLNRNHVFDSSGPEMRVRGTAQQLFDKYTQMARDAASSGDRVLGEAYYQHAEHYFRIISAINQAQGLPNPPPGGQPNGQQGSYAQLGEDGEIRPEVRPEPRQDQRQEHRQDYRPENRQENRPERQDRQENREPRPENRGENRGENRNENRDNRQNRFEQRPRPEFQPRDRNDRGGERPFRQPQPQIAEAPIDISSALEAELAAAVAEPAGYGEQPAIQKIIQQELPIATPEPRAIPISPAAPPPPAAEAPAEPAPRPRRGRPRKVDTAPE